MILMNTNKSCYDRNLAKLKLANYLDKTYSRFFIIQNQRASIVGPISKQYLNRTVHLCQ